MPVGGSCFYALVPEHAHPSYMFVLHFDDQTALRMNGKIIPAQHGKLFSLGPDIRHQELPSDTPPRYIAVLVDPSFFEQQLALYPRAEGIRFSGSFSEPRGDLLPLLKKFMGEAESIIPGRETVLHALATELTHAIIRSTLNFDASNFRISSRIEINRVIEYVHAHIDGKLTVESMAGVAHMSPSHFARVFKEETGKPPMDYLHHIRLARAKKLLIAGDRSITDIALACGFNSHSYLSTCFKKEYRMTPSEYQQRLQKGRISKNNRKISKA